ncbi:MAG: NAD(P)-dependent glycerol-3-phosphate dehydrogenase [Pelagimonas sp.]|jgi:glycerol-3-phosphate dehydrogenase (NAD(P)+)|nr:NAD(P)-dependent glycerol-3-phosphate dehydrogenase [Pelagimonas sp.]
MRVAVLGGGAFGSALAVALAQTGPVTLWARNVDTLLETRESPRLPGIRLPDTVDITADLDQGCAADAILFSTPMQSLHGLLKGIHTDLTGKHLVACCKGIDLKALEGPATLMAHYRPEATPAILTGPSFAADIARGLPTALTLACTDQEAGARLQHRLSTPTLRLYRSKDVIGAELGGALKNVMAIACGACMGAGLGDSARAALMTRGFAEMTRLAVSMGAHSDTLAGLSGLGDLTLTCTSDLSRNYRFGYALGQGAAFDPTVTVEGAATARAAARIAQAQKLPMPIVETVAQMAKGDLTVPQAMSDLLSRPLKDE